MSDLSDARRWIVAAEAARSRARRASAKAAACSDVLLARRFEREAELNLRSAQCFESAGRAIHGIDAHVIGVTERALRD
jgi:hypothetical protein